MPSTRAANALATVRFIPRNSRGIFRGLCASRADEPLWRQELLDGPEVLARVAVDVDIRRVDRLSVSIDIEPGHVLRRHRRLREWWDRDNAVPRSRRRSGRRTAAYSRHTSGSRCSRWRTRRSPTRCRSNRCARRPAPDSRDDGKKPLSSNRAIQGSRPPAANAARPTACRRKKARPASSSPANNAATSKRRSRIDALGSTLWGRRFKFDASNSTLSTALFRPREMLLRTPSAACRQLTPHRDKR